MSHTVINKEKLLLVEGKDELGFFNALLKYQDIQGVQLIDIGGIKKFKIEMTLLRNAEGFNKITHIAYVRDAEGNPATSAFSSICDALKKLSLPVPLKINSVLKDTYPWMGVFIMPDNHHQGMLEDLCLNSIKSQPRYACVESFMNCVSSLQTAEEKLVFNGSKASIQAYLTTRTPIVNSLGIAAQKGYWDFSSANFNPIKEFLAEMFSDTSIIATSL